MLRYSMVASVLVIFVFVRSVVQAAPSQSASSESSNTVLDQAVGLANSAVELKANILTPPEKTRESVKLETEALPSRVLSVYDDKQQKTADILNHTPIIDTISEREKYGNNGELSSGLGRAFVNSYEAFANLLNRIFNKPEELARAISQGITSQLDNIGARLVGLA